MCSVTVIILLACLAHAGGAEELVAKRTVNTWAGVNDLIENLVNKLFHHAFQLVPIHQARLHSPFVHHTHFSKKKATTPAVDFLWPVDHSAVTRVTTSRVISAAAGAPDLSSFEAYLTPKQIMHMSLSLVGGELNELTRATVASAKAAVAAEALVNATALKAANAATKIEAEVRKVLERAEAVSHQNFELAKLSATDAAAARVATGRAKGAVKELGEAVNPLRDELHVVELAVFTINDIDSRRAKAIAKSQFEIISREARKASAAVTLLRSSLAQAKTAVTRAATEAETAAATLAATSNDFQALTASAKEAAASAALADQEARDAESAAELLTELAYNAAKSIRVSRKSDKLSTEDCRKSLTNICYQALLLVESNNVPEDATTAFRSLLTEGKRLSENGSAEKCQVYEDLILVRLDQIAEEFFKYSLTKEDLSKDEK